MEQLLTFTEKLCERPSMFVGKTDMRLVATFLEGYETGLVDAHVLPDYIFRDFTDWLNVTYPPVNIEEPRKWWTEKLLEMYGENDSIKKLPILLREWNETTK